MTEHTPGTVLVRVTHTSISCFLGKLFRSSAASQGTTPGKAYRYSSVGRFNLSDFGVNQDPSIVSFALDTFQLQCIALGL
jgi:hypothetical protein